MNTESILPLFRGSLSDKQSQGLQAIIDACAQYQVTDQRMIAYILATAYWETARTMQPIEEFGKGAGRAYGRMIKQSGQPYTTPDHIYYGRGHTQNTWYENYEMLSNQSYAKTQGWDFLNNPELLLTMEPSLWATIHCMWHGSYTGVGLSKYFTADATDWVNARRIINGTDQAENIAEFAQAFYQYLQS